MKELNASSQIRLQDRRHASTTLPLFRVLTQVGSRAPCARHIEAEPTGVDTWPSHEPQWIAHAKRKGFAEEDGYRCAINDVMRPVEGPG